MAEDKDPEDWGDFKAAENNDADVMASLLESARQMSIYEMEVEETEGLLKALNSSLQKLRIKTVPDLMQTLGVDEVTVGNRQISVKEDLIGSIPSGDPEKGDPEKRAKAFDWLAKNDGAELIKNTVTITFGKGEEDLANKLASELMKKNYSVDVRKTVHPQTLLAWARERLRSGEKLALDILGLQPLRIAKVKQVKAKGLK